MYKEEISNIKIDQSSFISPIKSVIKSNEAINDAKQNLAYLQSFKQLKDSIESVVGSSKQFESSLSSLITKLGSLLPQNN